MLILKSCNLENYFFLLIIFYPKLIWHSYQILFVFIFQTAFYIPFALKENFKVSFFKQIIITLMILHFLILYLCVLSLEVNYEFSISQNIYLYKVISYII